jgi:cbb3-type cytochrome oxidase maturation protein
VFYYEWVSLVLISLWVSFVAFMWGLRSGQFRDQERARYLPLVGELADAPKVNTPSRAPVTIYVLAAIAITGFFILAIPVVLGLSR